jgi:flagellar basal body-associated protein FliL
VRYTAVSMLLTPVTNSSIIVVTIIIIIIIIIIICCVHAVVLWLSTAKSWKVAGSKPYEVNDFYQFTESLWPTRP